MSQASKKRVQDSFKKIVLEGEKYSFYLKKLGAPLFGHLARERDKWSSELLDSRASQPTTNPQKIKEQQKILFILFHFFFSLLSQFFHRTDGQTQKKLQKFYKF